MLWVGYVGYCAVGSPGIEPGTIWKIISFPAVGPTAQARVLLRTSETLPLQTSYHICHHLQQHKLCMTLDFLIYSKIYSSQIEQSVGRGFLFG